MDRQTKNPIMDATKETLKVAGDIIKVGCAVAVLVGLVIVSVLGWGIVTLIS